MTTKNLQSILDNFINGNLTDFQEAIKKLTKKEMLQLVMLWQEQLPGETYHIINHLSR